MFQHLGGLKYSKKDILRLFLQQVWGRRLETGKALTEVSKKLPYTFELKIHFCE